MLTPQALCDTKLYAVPHLRALCKALISALSCLFSAVTSIAASVCCLSHLRALCKAFSALSCLFSAVTSIAASVLLFISPESSV